MPLVFGYEYHSQIEAATALAAIAVGITGSARSSQRGSLFRQHRR